MPGLVALAPWEEPPDPSLVERLLDRAPHRAAAGRATLVLPGCALGTVSGLLERDERRGLALAADVRLDNQDELESALAPRDERPSLAELLLLGWERWGTGLAEKLAGDFALAIWDERRRQLYAARDAFGVRPLFHAHSGRSLVLASEVGQLLALEDVDRELEDGVVLDFLASRFAHGRETFFRGIARVRPGHFLLASSSSFREVRWFEPPREELRFRRKGECEEAFRALAWSAVSSRLDSGAPVIVQMSGGLDSSSIACLAGEIARRNGRHLPHLRMVSASFPGLRCDETSYQEAVARSAGLAWETYDGTALDAPPRTAPIPDYPWRASRPDGGGWRRIAAREGARVVLSGRGGDELLFERGVFRDLAAHGRLVDLVRETRQATRYSTRSQRFFLEDALRLALPEKVRHGWRRVRPRAPEPPPRWLAPGLDPRMLERGDPPPEGPFLSHAQRATWEWLTSPQLAWALEVEGLEATHSGLELRYPFLDVRLARFVLSLPFDRRIPGGRMKRLLRDSLSGILPREVAERDRVTTFEEVLALAARAGRDEVRSILEGSRWESARYVDLRAARSLLESLDGDRDPETWRFLWDVAMLEEWLRARPFVAGRGRGIGHDAADRRDTS